MSILKCQQKPFSIANQYFKFTFRHLIFIDSELSDKCIDFTTKKYFF